MARQKSPKEMTNEEFVANIMKWGNPLKQVFVIEAITRYAKLVSESDPIKCEWMSGEAWKAVGTEIHNMCEEKYGK